MIRKGRDIYLKVKTEKVGLSAEFFKRIFKISSWLNKRYDFNSTDCEFDQQYVDDDFVKSKVTIRLRFHEKER